MELKRLNGNVLEQKFNEPTLIIHCCNAYGRFGSGFAAAVAHKYPAVKTAYIDWYTITSYLTEDDEVPFMLGHIQPVPIHKYGEVPVYIVNMIGQSVPGGESFTINSKTTHLRPVRLDSIKECLYRVGVLANKLNAKVVGPEFCGGLAGANFETEVVPIINEVLIENNVDVTIYTLET